jgi:hypothetical protein
MLVRVEIGTTLNIISNGDISQTISSLNKDSSSYKLSIIPNSTQTNNSQVKITTFSNLLQDYEFLDPLKVVTNIKPNIISLDLESSVAPPVIKTKIKEEKQQSERPSSSSTVNN